MVDILIDTHAEHQELVVVWVLRAIKAMLEEIESWDVGHDMRIMRRAKPSRAGYTPRGPPRRHT